MVSTYQQYLCQDFLSPVPSTPTDTKTSPLALLAQTCQNIGASLGDSNSSTVAHGQKRKHLSLEQQQQQQQHSSPSNHCSTSHSQTQSKPVSSSSNASYKQLTSNDKLSQVVSHHNRAQPTSNNNFTPKLPKIAKMTPSALKFSPPQQADSTTSIAATTTTQTTMAATTTTTSTATATASTTSINSNENSCLSLPIVEKRHNDTPVSKDTNNHHIDVRHLNCSSRSVASGRHSNSRPVLSSPIRQTENLTHILPPLLSAYPTTSQTGNLTSSQQNMAANGLLYQQAALAAMAASYQQQYNAATGMMTFPTPTPSSLFQSAPHQAYPHALGTMLNPCLASSSAGAYPKMCFDVFCKTCPPNHAALAATATALRQCPLGCVQCGPTSHSDIGGWYGAYSSMLAGGALGPSTSFLPTMLNGASGPCAPSLFSTNPLSSSLLNATAAAHHFNNTLLMPGLVPFIPSLPAGQQQPSICWWDKGDGLCFKRFTNNEDFFNHLRTHALDSTNQKGAWLNSTTTTTTTPTTTATATTTAAVAATINPAVLSSSSLPSGLHKVSTSSSSSLSLSSASASTSTFLNQNEQSTSTSKIKGDAATFPPASDNVGGHNGGKGDTSKMPILTPYNAVFLSSVMSNQTNNQHSKLFPSS